MVDMWFWGIQVCAVKATIHICTIEDSALTISRITYHFVITQIAGELSWRSMTLKSSSTRLKMNFEIYVYLSVNSFEHHKWGWKYIFSNPHVSHFGLGLGGATWCSYFSNWTKQSCKLHGNILPDSLTIRPQKSEGHVIVLLSSSLNIGGHCVGILRHVLSNVANMVAKRSFQNHLQHH